MEKQIKRERGSVYCNNNVLQMLQESLQILKPTKVFVLVDSSTQVHCLPYFLNETNLKSLPEIIVIPESESHKTIETCTHVWNTLSESGADRSSLLINLGGGVVTDLGGFVACTFRRGIEFINIPTTLLAMVDASVGGKNGVDLGILKNQIGVIKNPFAVFIDTTFLDTLPKNEIRSGFAEMLKHGLIQSETYWHKLKDFDVKNKEITETLIWESILIKHTIVHEDPTEQGVRKMLNFGHTLGHAIESFCLSNKNRRTLLHGEAIAIGMILALHISSLQTDFDTEKVDAICQTIHEIYPKEHFNSDEIEKIIDLLKFDKKNKGGAVLFVLLEDFEKHKLNQKVDNQRIKSAFMRYEK